MCTRGGRVAHSPWTREQGHDECGRKAIAMGECSQCHIGSPYMYPFRLHESSYTVIVSLPSCSWSV